MADKKKGGMLQPTPYNESPGEEESPNISGGGIYVSYDEVMSAHLSTEGASLVNSPNMEEQSAIFGGPAPGEPSVAKPPFKTTG